MRIPNAEKRINSTERMVNYQYLRESFLSNIDDIQQNMLKTAGETGNPLETLSRVYEQLNDQQKITFILVGGAGQLFRYQRQAREKFQKERREQSSSDPATGALPVIC